MSALVFRPVGRGARETVMDCNGAESAEIENGERRGPTKRFSRSSHAHGPLLYGASDCCAPVRLTVGEVLALYRLSPR